MSASTKSIGPFLGIDNRVPDHTLARVERGRKAGDYLRNAVNVDLTNSGTLERRAGTERVIEQPDCHSLWSDGRNAFFVSGDTLRNFNGDVIRSGLTPGARLAYTPTPMGDVVWSNGVVIEKIAHNVSAPLGPRTPNPAPAVSVQSGGALPAGQYLLAFASVDANGEESAPTPILHVEVPENGAIAVAGIAGLTSLYLSSVNGDLLFWAGASSASTYVIATVPPQGPQLTTAGLRSMPAGHIVRWFNGRLLVAAGATLFYSESFSPALYDPSRGYIPFPDRITVLEPCGDGVFIVADQTYYLAGADIDGCAVRELLPYGAVEGTGCKAVDDQSVRWFSTRGLVLGTPDGQVKNVQEGSVATGGADVGASLVREQDGINQVISSLFNAQTVSAVASSFFEAELVRKESMR